MLLQKLLQVTLKDTSLDAPGTEISNAIYRMKLPFSHSRDTSRNVQGCSWLVGIHPILVSSMCLLFNGKNILMFCMSHYIELGIGLLYTLL